jgi:xylulokinase
MSHSDLILAVDLGTSGARAGVFDPRGRLVDWAEVGYPTSRPQPGWVEQSADDWWAACRQVIGLVTARIERGSVRALCAVGLAPAMTCVDEDGRPVRPSPIWCDSRARAVHAELAERSRPGAVPMWFAQLVWMLRHEPDCYRRTRWALQSYEYLSFRLTGTTAAIVSAREAEPDGRSLAAFELDPAHRPETVRCPGDLIGALSPQIAQEVGLPAGLPVIAGTVDCFATWIGTGSVRGGTLCITTGTSGGVAIVSDRRIADSRGRVGSMPHVIGDRWVLVSPMSSGGNVVVWFAKQFYSDGPDPITRLSNDAASILPGADGLIALPYLIGERAPIDNPQARSVFFGIGLAHTRAHFARAVLESVAFAVLDICEVMREAGAVFNEVRLAGPAAHNITWSRIAIKTVARLGALGPDVMKLQFPVDRQHEPDEAVWSAACAELSDASRVPWALLSAGDPFGVFKRQLQIACEAGCSGFMAGRALWSEVATAKECERAALLEETVVPRMEELNQIADRYGHSWQKKCPLAAIEAEWPEPF